VRMSETPATTNAATTKAKLLKRALLSGRGVWARPSEMLAVTELVEELEQNADSPTLQDGVWELIVSDVEPFRASTFFLALGEAIEENIKEGASDGALTVHSLATGGGEVGRVAHVIEGNGSRLHSLVELTSGSLPSLPLALTGTVISSGELAPSASKASTFELTLKNTTVQQSRIRYGLPSDDGLKPGVEQDLLSFIGDEFVNSGEIFQSVLETTWRPSTAELLLSYADDELMVWRTPRMGNHFFVFVRGDTEVWPVMDELRRRQASASQSPIDSSFALGMLNSFFTRAAGLKK